MPGRLAFYDESFIRDDLKSVFISFEDKFLFNKSFNIAPTHYLSVFLNTKILTKASFGLLSTWAKDTKNININARSESLFEKITFREAFKNRRCLIFVNGFYEWNKDAKNKKSYYIQAKNNKYFTLAGLYNEYYNPVKNRVFLTVCIITTDANILIKTIHERMPAIIEKKDWKIYLDETSELQDINKLLKIQESSFFDMHEVSNEVNKVKNNYDSLINEKKQEDNKIPEGLF